MIGPNTREYHFREVGMTDNANDYPMDNLVLELFAAFNNVEVSQLKWSQKFHANEYMQSAWGRVAIKAKEILGDKT